MTTVDLLVQISKRRTEVTATLEMVRQGSGQGGLRLDGEQLSLQWIELDGERLTEDEYTVGDTDLIVASVPDRFSLRTWYDLPEENTSLEGFYRSQSAYCTQCEAEGFRKITYFPIARTCWRFNRHTRGGSRRVPVLLSNGNKVSEEDLDNGRHRWCGTTPSPNRHICSPWLPAT
ncbi:MAG: hypothetical protein CM15mP103_04560 [Gammaproteobacteria bacterium]|nr:MAG: hypothetical protein CM15mP103_04560 [Gammaproteobacteria bacterium]